MSRLCAFCARPALSISNACVVCLRELDREKATLTSDHFRKDAAERASRPSEWLGKVAECDAFRADLQARPTVDGSLASLAGLEPGRAILLELSGVSLVGRILFSVDPAPAVVAGRPGSLYVDASDKTAWTDYQCEAYRKLDELVESLDHAADDAPKPFGDETDFGRPEDGTHRDHEKAVGREARRVVAAEKADAARAREEKKADRKQRDAVGRSEFPAWVQRRKGGGL